MSTILVFETKSRLDINVPPFLLSCYFSNNITFVAVKGRPVSWHPKAEGVVMWFHVSPSLESLCLLFNSFPWLALNLQDRWKLCVTSGALDMFRSLRAHHRGLLSRRFNFVLICLTFWCCFVMADTGNFRKLAGLVVFHLMVFNLKLLKNLRWKCRLTFFKN